MPGLPCAERQALRQRATQTTQGGYHVERADRAVRRENRQQERILAACNKPHPTKGAVYWTSGAYDTAVGPWKPLGPPSNDTAVRTWATRSIPVSALPFRHGQSIQRHTASYCCDSIGSSSKYRTIYCSNFVPRSEFDGASRNASITSCTEPIDTTPHCFAMTCALIQARVPDAFARSKYCCVRSAGSA